ncbi:hypothetical protein E1B28_008837 [Marasmius oreades]|uniref:Transmembrane protein 135 n=1 Tax=Marasmius oreades TaxID=181124 RepID=A0A9P7RZV3_9AGAR|nr:uncharacterized protein E1B28_008837 [Marasmius oreades]KAG7092485.1 hypothetical protein E1B28_008837 [Marasmius oreades]
MDPSRLRVPIGGTPFTTAPSSSQDTPDEADQDDNEHFIPSERDIPEIPDSSAPTPSSAIHFMTGSGRRNVEESNVPFKRAMASFENLVALANSQEALRNVLANRKETLKGARKMVWRDRGEPVAELADGEECLKWAVKGGLRAAGLAFNIRACFSLVLALIRIRSVPRNYRFALIRRAIFGLDTWRFAAMLGTFVSLYKLVLNALPLYVPSKPHREYTSAFSDNDETENDDTLPMTSFDVPVPPTPGGPLYTKTQRPKRTERLSLSTQAQRIMVRKKTKRWHAALAGAIAGGLAVMWEKRGRRVTVAQQMFVRGLQGSYNSYTTKRNVHVPYGDVLVFSLACGQILYTWLLRPGTLPRSYERWVGNASKVSDPALRMNYDLVKFGKLDIKDIEEALELPQLTAENASRLLDLKKLFFADPSSLPPDQYIPNYGPCAAIHPAETSCFSVPPARFFQVFKWMLPVYGALHLIPPVLFKWKTFTKDPSRVLTKAIIGTGRSSAFLGVFVIIYQSINCFNHQLHEYLFTRLSPSSSVYSLIHNVIPRWLIDLLLTSKWSFWLPGFLSGLALFIEEKRRRPELAMYVLPKGLEATWLITTGKVGFKQGRKGKFAGEALLTAVGMAMVMSTYQNDPQHLSGLVRRMLYQFVGPN